MPQTSLNQRGPVSRASTPPSIAEVPEEVSRQQVACFFPVASHGWRGAAGSRGKEHADDAALLS
jgi:hypothetical protein